MSTIELKKRLIDKIQKTDNENLLGEAFRLLEMESEDIEIYKLNDGQKKAIEEARKQITKSIIQRSSPNRSRLPSNRQTDR